MLLTSMSLLTEGEADATGDRSGLDIFDPVQTTIPSKDIASILQISFD